MLLLDVHGKMHTTVTHSAQPPIITTLVFHAQIGY